MPTYDYECNACGHTFELFQSFNDSLKKKCPACSKFKLRRLIGTGAAIVFKGSGFYQTDYRSDSYKKAAKADQKKAEKKETKSDSGGTTKEKSSDKSTTSSPPKKPDA